jgi:hypothetical protein
MNGVGKTMLARVQSMTKVLPEVIRARGRTPTRKRTTTRRPKKRESDSIQSGVSDI